MFMSGSTSGAPSVARLGRRPVLGACLAGTLLMAADRPARALTRPPAGLIPFTVYRGGSRIGHHHTRFSEQGAVLRVDIEIRLTVRFAGIPVFRYTHDSVERWRDGRLIEISSDTDDDGRIYRLRGRAENGVFRVSDGRDGPWEAPPDIIPTSYWHKGVTRNERLLHTQYGAPFELSTQLLGRDTIEAAGTTIEADRYRLSASLIVDAWYNLADQWVKLSFSARGSEIEDVLDPGAEGASTLATRS